ncbi:MAG: hypothetical protein PHN90_10825 [Methanothrix sp.]|nr:hypothetical protein [Methanothrix sp.]
MTESGGRGFELADPLAIVCSFEGGLFPEGVQLHPELVDLFFLALDVSLSLLGDALEPVNLILLLLEDLG